MSLILKNRKNNFSKNINVINLLRKLNWYDLHTIKIQKQYYYSVIENIIENNLVLKLYYVNLWDL